VSRAHAFIEQDCAKCHTDRFTAVTADACFACHPMGAHVPVDQGEDPSCTSCHVEHKGRVLLHEVEDTHCNACHADHKGVTDLASHIAFRPAEVEQHLRFDHRRHLEADLVGGPLACRDCHRPDRAREHFVPIAFATHCARCHTDRLDGDVPAPVPHGLETHELRAWIEGAFLTAMRADGELAEDPANPMPGHGATARPPWADTVAKRTDAALGALVDPDRERGCLLCHVIEAETEETIARPAIPRSWYRAARFDHDAHRTVDCTTCHTMRDNARAGVLALPQVAVCRDCHNEEAAGNTCVTCHPYHPR
jgi:predicted CXXCH cytochrome family protein